MLFRDTGRTLETSVLTVSVSIWLFVTFSMFLCQIELYLSRRKPIQPSRVNFYTTKTLQALQTLLYKGQVIQIIINLF